MIHFAEKEVTEEPTIDQWTTKERAPYPYWIHAYACNVNMKLFDYKPLLSWKEYRDRMKLLAKLRKVKREMKREPVARQVELVFPLQLTPNEYEVQKVKTEGEEARTSPLSEDWRRRGGSTHAAE